SYIIPCPSLLYVHISLHAFVSYFHCLHAENILRVGFLHNLSVAAQAEKRMDIQAPLTAVYIHTVPALPAQPYPQPPAAAREPATLHLAMPPLYSKETLPFLTLHIAGGLQSQPGLSLAAAAPASRESKQTAADDPMLSEEKTSTTLYRCHICNYIFTKKTSNLQNHMRVHTGERPYSCHFCGKCFKLKGHMTEHIRTHTGEKPFSCHICDKSFNRGSTLRKHVLAKHKEERHCMGLACNGSP
uniref:C2H2-type domain-containing protein n=1 Tax=Amphiprion ocellaris TaxID=80972 RepID=A0AAQ6A2T8_AMPOC